MVEISCWMMKRMDNVEILSVELLDQHRPLVTELHKLTRTMRLDFGWHYLLDLVWIIDQLDLSSDKRVIDAGAGVGIMQWYLAGKGVDVYSIDRGSRADLGLFFRSRYKINGVRDEDLVSSLSVIAGDMRQSGGVAVQAKRQVKNLLSAGRGLMPKIGSGQIMIYNQDLKALNDILDGSVDAIVAVSALEHNTPDGLREVVTELLRTLKPGGKLLVTLGAAVGKDWFHEASHGWNYTAGSLKDIFRLEPGAPDNYDRHSELFDALKDCAELRDNLAAFYSQSGDNGMPWGKWDPQYIPVGVCKIKPA